MHYLTCLLFLIDNTIVLVLHFIEYMIQYLRDKFVIFSFFYWRFIMFKKFIVILTMFFASFVAQAIELSGFYIDTVNPVTGGNTTVHWGAYDGANWANHFQVHIDPYASIINNPDIDFTIPNWITPVANGGATFNPVELYAIWGPNNEVFTTSMGNGEDGSWTGRNLIGFGRAESSWDVTLTPVTSVPEPETYAMMLAGLGLMTVIARKKAGKSNLSTN